MLPVDLFRVYITNLVNDRGQGLPGQSCLKVYIIRVACICQIRFSAIIVVLNETTLCLVYVKMKTFYCQNFNNKYVRRADSITFMVAILVSLKDLIAW